MFTKSKGITIVEVVIVVLIITIIFTALTLLITPGRFTARARDDKKLSDLYKFESEINDYMLEYGSYPNTTPPLDINYAHEGKKYEVNTSLEYYLEKSQNDGGDDEDLFESGNDLTLL